MTAASASHSHQSPLDCTKDVASERYISMDVDVKTMKYTEGVNEEASRDSCLRCIPLNYRTELVQLLKLAGPVVRIRLNMNIL